MSISDELKELETLHRNGTLSREEFEIAKWKVLEGPPTAQTTDRLTKLEVQNEIAQLDREWEMERENYMIRGKYGNKFVPGRASSIIVGICIVGFGLFMMNFLGSAGFGQSNVFSIFGLLLILIGGTASIFHFVKADQYQKAHQSYQRRRQELLHKS